MREHLLDHSDHATAGRLAGDLINLVNERLNEAGIQVGTSILCRALVTFGIIDVAASWWAEGTDPTVALPDAMAVMRSFVTDLPPHFTSVNWRDDEEKPE